ncbi:MAG TPA: cytochrome C [Myxococcota bacterium]|nr:cytochrome C [Myxococcota bacterium]
MSARAAAWTAASALAASALVAAAAHAEPPPAQDYVLECRGCHGAHGEGTPGKVPSLAPSARFLATPRGRAYLVRVPGVAGSQLSDARIAALLNWMLRELASNPPALTDFASFTAGEVARARADKLLDPGAERAAILDGR